MGKMKELFMQQMEEQRSNMSDAEYQDWLNSQEPATQEEVEVNHNTWWDSLTDKQKQQLYDSKEELFELTIEEMNHDLGFGK